MKTLKKVLLVDDDDAANFYNQMILEDMGIVKEIVVKSNGLEALEYLKETCFDSCDIKGGCPEIIFLDINMPVMTGIELLEALKDLNKEFIAQNRIVILTSSSNKRDIEVVKTLGVKSYCNKPLTEEKIYALINSGDHPTYDWSINLQLE